MASGVTVIFYTYRGHPNLINKNLSNGYSTTAELYDNTNILNPELKLSWSNSYATSYDMFYIAEFKRYYFIKDIIAEPGGAVRVKGSIDVLYTYANSIGNSTALITREYDTPGHSLTYIKDGQYPLHANRDIQIYELYGNNPFNLTTANDLTYNFVLNVMGRSQAT